MRKNGKNKGILSILLLTACTLVIVFVGRQLTTTAQTRPDVAPPIDARKIIEPQRKVILDDDPEWKQQVSLETLARESKVIVVGRAGPGVGNLSTSGPQVTTDYDVRVTEVIKNGSRENPTIRLNSVISVRMPGGMARDSDGTLLAVMARHVFKMQNGKFYVLFLKDSGLLGGGFTPLRGSQGLFEVPESGAKVIRMGTFPPSEGEDVSAFMDIVRRLGRNR